MARLVFERVSMRNFFTYGNVPTVVELNSHGTTFISGKNGVGKSTITDAICFALFNKPYKNIKKSSVVNSINRKNCVVELEFTIGPKKYKVVRGIKPNVFDIFVDGEMMNNPTDSRDFQNILEEQIVKMSFKTFTQLIVLGSSGYVPFMSLKPEVRRTVVDDILDAEVYTDMHTILKKEIAETKKQRELCDTKLDAVKSNIMSVKKALEAVEADRESVINHWRDEAKKTKQEIEESQSKLSELSDKRGKLSEIVDSVGDISEKRQRYVQVRTKLNDSLKQIDQTVKWFTSTHQCPTCDQSISKDFAQAKIDLEENRKATIESELPTLQEKIQKLEEGIKRKNDLEVKLNSVVSDCMITKSQLKTLSDRLDAISLKIEELSTPMKNVDDLRANLILFEREHEELKKELDELSKTALLQRAAYEILKDGGIKTNIIRQYIPIFNHLINKYLDMMGLFISFQLDENFEESVKSRHRDEFTYENFSEGQKQRINYAIMFAWREVAALKNSASSNLLFLDEVLNSSLDGDGVEYLLEWLLQQKNKLNIFVVSHHSKELLEGMFDRTLNISLVDGFARIEES